VSGWFKRFGLHLAAAVGATGIFVAAAAVGANQTREQVAAVSPVTVPPARIRAQPTPASDSAPATTPALPRPRTKPAARASPDPVSTPTPRPAPAADKVVPERSLAGTIKEALPEGGLVVQGVGGREWRIMPAPGALIRLNGKAARLDALREGDNVVILGQAQPGAGNRFVAHAITARRK
jgi:hypothetical protein